MTLKSNTAEGGTNGTTVTAANSGGASGDAFATPTINGSSTFTFDNSQTMHGTLSYKYGCVNATTTFNDWTGYSATAIAVRFYFRLSALPSAAAGTRLADVRDTAPVGVGRVIINSANKLIYQNNGSTLYTAGAALSANTWYRVEFVCCTGTGVYRFDYYAGDSATPVETGFVNLSQASGSAATIATMRWGNSGSNTYAGSLWLDDVAANDGVTTYLGPSVTAYTGSPADPVGITDAAAFERSVTVADGVGITDTGGPITFDAAYGVDDPVGLTDSATRITDGVRAPGDPVGITDSAGPVADNVRTAADPVGATDAATIEVGRTSADPVGISDSAAGVVDAARAPADSVPTTDALTLDRQTTAADAVPVTDAASTLVDSTRSQGETVGITDTLQVDFTGTTLRNVTDPVGVTDAATSAGDLVRPLADTAGITDSATLAVDVARPLADVAGITDSVTAVLDRVVTVADLLAVIDEAQASLLHGDVITPEERIYRILAESRGYLIPAESRRLEVPSS